MVKVGRGWECEGGWRWTDGWCGWHVDTAMYVHSVLGGWALGPVLVMKGSPLVFVSVGR